MRFKKHSLILSLLVLVMVLACSVTVFAAGDVTLKIENNATQPFVDQSTLIHEEVWIETLTDTDGDGLRDLVYAKITRPGETEYGLKSPVIIDPTPYDSTTSNMSTAFSDGTPYENDWEWFNWYIMQDPDSDQVKNPDTTNLNYVSDIAFQVPHTYAEIAAANYNPDWLPAMREAESVGEANRIGAWCSATNWKQYFISRGYAAIRVNTMGDFNSEGHITVGDYNEALAMASVVDWLNGRVKAFTTPEGKVEVKADWATGKAAFNGTSYPGQLSLMAAMTGVEGLETIIPEAAPINWYDYYRAGGGIWAPGGYQGEDLAAHMVYCQTRQQDKYSWSGTLTAEAQTKPTPETHDFITAYIEDMLVQQDRVTGDYSEYWDARNKAIFAKDIKCSILITHGLNDWNVKFKHAAQLVEMCKYNNIEWKAIFHSGAHTSAFGFDGVNIYEDVHAWLDHYLVGLDNGMPGDMDKVSIVNSNTMEWETYDTWPINDNEYTALYLNDMDGDASLGYIGYNTLTNEEVSFKDTYVTAVPADQRDAIFGTPNSDNNANLNKWLNYIVGGDEDLANLDLTKPLEDRLLYLSEPLTEDVRLSGASKVTLEVKTDSGLGSISVMVVDYGENANATTQRGTTLVDLGNGRTASLSTPVKGSTIKPFKMVTVGAVDVQNPNATGKIWLDTPETNFVPEYWYQTKDVAANEYNTYVFDLTPTDHVFPEGHQIGILVYSIDPRYTLRPSTATEFTVDLSKSKVELPLIGDVDYPLQSEMVIEDGETQVFVDQNRLIHEEVWIETLTDTDGDGQRDLIYAKITRPGETEYGLKSPSLIQVTPYTTTDGPTADGYLETPDIDYNHPDNPDTTDQTYSDVEFTGKTWADIAAADFNPDWLPAMREAKEIGEANRVAPWLSATNWRQYFISRGYAAINVSSIGDFNCEGLVTVGDYNEALAAAAIVDWLNGRVKGFADPEGTIQVVADWSNGKAAMNGTSYNGETSLAAAITGVDGLETVIPEAPPVNWYDYYRSNGMVWAPGAYQGEDLAELQVYCQTRHKDKTNRAGEITEAALTKPDGTTTTYIQNYLDEMVEKQDRITGDYSEYWDARNLVKYFGDVKASILQTHGYNDWNVKFKSAALIWEAAEAYGIEHKAIFHQGGHSSALGYDGMDIYNRLHGWLDHYLVGLDNGMPEDMPNVQLINNSTMEWEEHESWPLGGNEFYPFYFRSGRTDGKVGTVSQFSGSDMTADFVDEYIPSFSAEQRDPEGENVFGYMASDRGYAVTEWENLIATGDVDSANMDLTQVVTDRLLYTTAALDEDVRLSGTTKATLRVAADKNVGALSVMVVDYGEIYAPTTQRNASKVDLGNGREASLSKWIFSENAIPYKVVTRGSVDVQNPNPSGKIWLDAEDTNYIPEYWYQTTDIEPGEYYDYVFDLVPTDYVFEEGHRIGFIIYGSDARYTTRPFDPTNFTVDLSESFVELPLVDFTPAEEPVDPEPPVDPETKTYTIETIASKGGKIFGNGSVYEEGSDATFTFEAKRNYEIEEVIIDGVEMGVITSYTFENIQEDHTIELICVSLRADDKDDDDDDDKKDEDKDDDDKDDEDDKPVVPADRENPFIDIKEADWFYNDVLDSYYAGLINGRTSNTYVPNGNITIAEAIKLAATMNQRYTTGSVTLTNGAEAWYSTYVDYAIANGIIKEGEYTDMNAVATRAQFASIFAAALPAEALPQINNIADDKIPDVKISDNYGSAVYKLYRAGILNGNDAAGTFAPMTNIKRSEVAAIVNRMMNSEKRVNVNL